MMNLMSDLSKQFLLLREFDRKVNDFIAAEITELGSLPANDQLIENSKISSGKDDLVDIDIEARFEKAAEHGLSALFEGIPEHQIHPRHVNPMNHVMWMDDGESGKVATK